jgi:hypothetical protein
VTLSSAITAILPMPTDFLKAISPAIFGGIISAFVTIYFNSRKNQTERCLQLLSTWTNTSLDEDRRIVWHDIQKFFKSVNKDESSETGLTFGDHVCTRPKLSEILDLSRSRPNYKSSFSEDFPDRFIRIMFFFSVLNTFLRDNLADEKLFIKLFKNSIMPWYHYLDMIEFDDSRVDHKAVFELKESLNNYT